LRQTACDTRHKTLFLLQDLSRFAFTPRIDKPGSWPRPALCEATAQRTANQAALAVIRPAVDREPCCFEKIFRNQIGDSS
ncbi:MAG TPA: hypothetical protein VLM41_04555, partial [Steroidobacteraceae bacterium]|nr:hypothetical protein [Steroidobacteraceae bacterium]